ncbi:MAG TPA: PTS beta-glucoside transporter subunit EIIBCA [Proteiniclasticum sp.]|uniref:beta-glucoside-specific PTS transporter subunit IIABC n=1 Tax=Proteiniclasticum sp. TaxID=2053595 RepID=UPI000E9B98E8|nr:beta-glucoside-specific PTS transporter subunit IIABC [Proteiniclasticum sp.]HBW13111.1 PTS beta-glucoside transporter subunit EIIBCA [Proteiniclasticum sp.]
MSNDKLAKALITNIGGVENITQVWHCITRLRFNIKNNDLVKMDTIKKMNGVLGAQFQSGQLQVIIGSEVADVFREVELLTSGKINLEAAEEKSMNVVEKVFDVISGIFTPILPAIVGGGLLKGIMAILSATNILSASSETYMILNAISDAVFYFLPFMLAYSASNKFKTSTALSLTLAGILMYPTFVNLATAGEITKLSFIGINIPVNNYSSSVIPIILGVWLLSYVERLAKKFVPKSLNIVFVPLIMLLVTAPIVLALIAPAGSFLGVYLERIFTKIFTVAGPFGGALMGGLMPLIVITGMHYAFFPGTFASFAKVGFDVMLLPMNLVANLAQAGATLGVLIKTKDSKMRQIAFSALIPAIFGITEPAIYGVTMRLKKPFYASLIGAAIGGATLAGLSVKAFSFTVPGILALPTYIEQGTYNFMFAVFGVVLSFGIALILTLVMKFDLGEEKTEVSPTTVISVETVKSTPIRVAAPITGEIKLLSECPDKTFASETMGKGVCIIPTEGKVVSPFDGKVILTTPTNHAIAVLSNDGVEVLIHVGLETVELEGEFFELKVSEGDIVNKGEDLLLFDLTEMNKRKINLCSPIVVTNTANYLDVLVTKNTGSTVSSSSDDILMAVN